MPLIVERETTAQQAPLLAPFMQAVQAALVEAEQLHELPADYTDITQGWLASWKRRIKAKLLNNFKRAYVDVLARQQSAFNRHVLHAVQELAECCATLAHAEQSSAKPASDGFSPSEDSEGNAVGSLPRNRELIDELAENRRQIAALERRLARLEALLLAREMVIT
jgi:hypothetical protein